MHQSWIDDFEKEIDYAKESGMEVIILGDRKLYILVVGKEKMFKCFKTSVFNCFVVQTWIILFD
jgi:hypothetical protein